MKQKDALDTRKAYGAEELGMGREREEKVSRKTDRDRFGCRLAHWSVCGLGGTGETVSLIKVTRSARDRVREKGRRKREGKCGNWATSWIAATMKLL
jgi:hypothetical protein